MSQEKKEVKEETEGLGFFEKYLTLWVAICIVAGILIGKLFPAFPDTLSKFEYAQVSIPVAILIWFMIYPMMVQIDFSSILEAGKRPKGLGLTLTVNWLIKPFTMAFFAWLFFKNIFGAFITPELADQYIAGAILLGAAPCTAMVFVWSYLTDGDASYTLVQVAVNDLVLVFAYAPLVMLLLGVTNFSVPYDTVFLSVVLYIVIPLVAGYLSRKYLIKNKGIDWFENVYLKSLDNFTIIGLLLTLIILFSFQGDIILNNPLDILLIAIPLTIQTFFIFVIGYGGAKLLNLEHSVAAPASMIGASNFFELAVATAISIFGLQSGAALATVVGVLVEVPVMLGLVAIANRTRHWFPQKSKA
ncbi:MULTISPECIES: ACR3 family arsenite efflux transporter [unclassified Candidatus Frackibacter]|uniref:ACR3 family arsenite efflux transporter n=1 Tax=unclassified Candidatus Frackibacter TaxID=2648818 RepID=UPI00088CCCDB|nr:MULTISPECIES: ACR3 family arsenite efflux transporter [unclassified Candidatus Frackibacter]SDC00490.1 arsenite transporter, ACR3 family [Candidatus Frackibacter sp. WG11]SEM31951.1 arsenite transporter, ACR3 family [Candidatus Frackibacter sp. WG12]SFL36849.1 arsenite transporter, ACR3 family [Candidatus Frackibacter sp. WG13]